MARKNADTAQELLVGFYKKSTQKPTLTWSESVDQALCFGWIDGVRRSIDGTSYSIRFTPRRANSIWSTLNVKKVADLLANGLMQPAGIAAFEKRNESKTAIYTYEKEPIELSAEFEQLFRANTQAWNFFTSQPPYYQRLTKHLVMNAKQEKTRQSRLKALIACSAEGKRLDKLKPA